MSTVFRNDVHAAEYGRPETAYEAEEWLTPVLEVPLDAERPVDLDADDYRDDS
jgi:hypothetical protein